MRGVRVGSAHEPEQGDEKALAGEGGEEARSSSAEADRRRSGAASALLKERMTYAGLKQQGVFPLPAWVLSEGTRRLVAICALLVHQQPPSLLCIEEIENGLDPWTVIYVLRLLQSAAARGTQVLLTTHSPWLLDHVPLEAILYVQRLNGETHYSRFASRKEVQAFSASVPPGAAYVNLENP